MLGGRGQTTTVRRIDAHDPAEHNQRAAVGRRMGTVFTANRNGRARNPESTGYREARFHLVVDSISGFGFVHRARESPSRKDREYG